MLRLLTGQLRKVAARSSQTASSKAVANHSPKKLTAFTSTALAARSFAAHPQAARPTFRMGENCRLETLESNPSSVHTVDDLTISDLGLFFALSHAVAYYNSPHAQQSRKEELAFYQTSNTLIPLGINGLISEQEATDIIAATKRVNKIGCVEFHADIPDMTDPKRKIDFTLFDSIHGGTENYELSSARLISETRRRKALEEEEALDREETLILLGVLFPEQAFTLSKSHHGQFLIEFKSNPNSQFRSQCLQAMHALGISCQPFNLTTIQINHTVPELRERLESAFQQRQQHSAARRPGR